MSSPFGLKLIFTEENICIFVDCKNSSPQVQRFMKSKLKRGIFSLPNQDDRMNMTEKCEFDQKLFTKEH